jgi:holo-[acyl-carrier protein] synthase|tara:strand:+ start:781 stop:1167 length:387 start_codon:yes stop_codon:yes gene_type:complete
MKFIGTGIDILENVRIEKAIKNDLFIKKIFSKEEIACSKKIKNKASFYSKRFAAKEAFVKSIGTGFRNRLSFRDITIINDKLGKPSFLINKRVRELIKKRFKTNKYNFLLSISDEKKYSIAIVIFQIL